jgi:hypothetical protein
MVGVWCQSLSASGEQLSGRGSGVVYLECELELGCWRRGSFEDVDVPRMGGDRAGTPMGKMCDALVQLADWPQRRKRPISTTFGRILLR